MTQKSDASASVVDGKLILSFPHAQTPVLWQMDLAQAKSSALEVLKAAKGGSYTLTLKTQKGEQVQIASFENREDAIEGLMAASNALKNGHGNMQIAANQDKKLARARTGHKTANKGQWMTGIIALLALALLFGLWGMVVPKTPTSIQSSSASHTQSDEQSNPATATQSAGVPVSADDFLSGQ